MRKIEITSGIFLIGLAALAVFDFWFPGILLVISISWYVWSHLSGWRVSPMAWFFLLGGIAIWLYNILVAANLASVFPILTIITGLVFIYKLNLNAIFGNDKNDPNNLNL